MNPRGKKILFAIIKIVFIVLVVVFGISLFLSSRKGGSRFDLKKIGNNEEMFIEDYFDDSEYTTSLKSEPSDIEGLTKYDKMKLGLNIEDGSDSDQDGLTDKEEIELYGTDPTKASTSGDLLTDGYKIANGLAVDKKHELPDAITIIGNECDEVELCITSATDINASIGDYTGDGFFDIPGKDIVKVFTVSNYTGEIVVDLAKINSELSADDINVYSQNFYDTQAKVVKFETAGSKIYLKDTYDYDEVHVIYIVREESALAQSFVANVVPSDITFGALGDDDDLSSRCYGVMYGWALNLKCAYVETGSEELDNYIKNRLVTAANNIYKELDKSMSIDEVEAVSMSEFEKIVNTGDRLPKISKPIGIITEYPGETRDWSSYGLLYTYYVVDEDAPMSVDTTFKNDNIVLNFNPSSRSDFLPFSNFGTEISPGGVCAGIAHLTSYLHNNGSLGEYSKDSFKFDGERYEYDITLDLSNATLLDSGLSDYKDAAFVRDHKSSNGTLTKNLSAGEKEFTTMISYFWALGNHSFSVYDYIKGTNGKDAGKDATIMNLYDGTVVRNIVAELDAGRFVDAHFILDNGSGHAVNLIGYQKKASSKDGSEQGYIFYVYDSNKPSVIGTLTCIVRTSSTGQESLLYNLNVPGASYHAHSGQNYSTAIGDINMFVALDSDFNVLND